MIIITVGLIGVWFYFVSWLSNSDRYIRLKLYIDSKLSDNILSTLFQEYINQTDWKFLKSLGNKTVCVYANTNNKDRAEYWIHLTFWKNQFIFEINEREIKYLYGPSKIEEQDIDDWIHLKKEDFASLSAKEILVKIHLLKETFVKEKNNK